MPAGRYAPSPSGHLHLGNLRTALLAWLFARSAGARFVLRIEDLDPERSRREHEARQLADLRAIGIDWDGAPVRQSERTALYAEALEKLRTMGRVYPCWCTRADIHAAAQAPHGSLPEGAYPGTCRRLTATGRAARQRESGRAPALRLDARDETVRFHDGLHGPVQGRVDDLVLRRSDGAFAYNLAVVVDDAEQGSARWSAATTCSTPRRSDGAFAYNLAVVVDDAEQGIGEVVRGDDLLDSTPRQLLLARLLGLPAPTYAHVPLVLGPDRRRLAKRHGAVTLADRAELGEGPARVLTWMAASLGLAGSGEEVSARQLIERFDAPSLPREPTVLDG